MNTDIAKGIVIMITGCAFLLFFIALVPIKYSTKLIHNHAQQDCFSGDLDNFVMIAKTLTILNMYVSIPLKRLVNQLKSSLKLLKTMWTHMEPIVNFGNSKRLSVFPSYPYNPLKIAPNPCLPSLYISWLNARIESHPPPVVIVLCRIVGL